MYKIFGDFKIYGKPIDDIVKYNDIVQRLLQYFPKFDFVPYCHDQCPDSSTNREIKSIINVIAQLSLDLNCFSSIYVCSKSPLIILYDFCML